MKIAVKSLLLAVTFVSASLLAGCASPLPWGLLFTKIKTPVALGNGSLEWEVKESAESISILGLFATGDASIYAATADKDIDNVCYVTYQVENYAGIYAKYTTVVYGMRKSTPAVK